VNEQAVQDGPILIVGGGHAGIALCGALVAAGCRQPIHLVCAEAELPYQRPPLSKDFIKKPDAAPQLHRSEAWLAEQGITVHLGDAAAVIERERRVLRLASGRELPYGQLVLATGAKARELPGVSPRLANVAVLRTAEDARRLRGLIDGCQRLTVLGGGFIGLEVAATARGLGKDVTVLEAAPRLLGRSVSPAVAEHLLDAHRANGIELRLGVKVDAPVVEGERLLSVEVDGQATPVDVLLLGIGAAPELSLAEAAGLACDNGVVVDGHMQTSDPAIFAIGDCTSFPRDGNRIRLESVQNAADQARTAAASLMGDRSKPYATLPWFWSDQNGLRVQIAGLLPAGAAAHRRPGATAASFSVLHYLDGKLCAVESVNAAPDHIAARRLLDKGLSPDPALACDPATTLASFAAV